MCTHRNEPEPVRLGRVNDAGKADFGNGHCQGGDHEKEPCKVFYPESLRQVYRGIANAPWGVWFKGKICTDSESWFSNVGILFEITAIGTTARLGVVPMLPMSFHALGVAVEADSHLH